MKEKTTKEKLIMIKFIKDIHVVDNLKTNLLIEMNIFGPERVIINLFKENIIFMRCRNVSIFMQFTF